MKRNAFTRSAQQVTSAARIRVMRSRIWRDISRVRSLFRWYLCVLTAGMTMVVLLASETTIGMRIDMPSAAANVHPDRRLAEQYGPAKQQ
ncbi:MAG: hypothetical protein L7U72_05300 [Rubripirellula sp.]|nr:hypothetical protein [Rubripirellula sp.]